MCTHFKTWSNTLENNRNSSSENCLKRAMCPKRTRCPKKAMYPKNATTPTRGGCPFRETQLDRVDTNSYIIQRHV